MKKMFLLVMILFSSSILTAVADTTINALIEFKKGEKKHISECFDLEKEFKSAKFDLLKRQHIEKFDLEEQALATLKSEGFSDELLQRKLAAKVALCEKHLEEMNMLCEKHYAVSKAKYRDAKAKLDDFKQANVRYTGYSYKPFEKASKSEQPNFLERALDLLKDSFPSGY